ADCVDLVADLAHRRFPDGPPHEVTWTWLDGSTATDPSTPVEGAWTRAPFRDAVVSEGSAIVMLDRVPVTLPGMAATVWLAAAEPATLADLVAAATVSHGPHPDAEALVGATLDALVERGLLLSAPGSADRDGA
ncbi:MAG TPA: hypothetical protein VFI44_11285, partial [Ornithinibacter sp.]|nr:hypothetical protein [Ornithinibacter sp.]